MPGDFFPEKKINNKYLAQFTSLLFLDIQKHTLLYNKNRIYCRYYHVNSPQ